ncbi:MAG: cobalamin-binding protein [Gammaproteobacteria bacterium]
MRFLCLLALVSPLAYAQIAVTDDRGDTLTLERPARRIVSLSPHITELLFAAGAGARVVGTVEYSDYPPAARVIPRIGNYGAVNLEALLALRPDLVVAWGSGSPAALVQRLRDLGVPVYVTEPRRLADIADHIARLGHLTGTAVIAQAATDDFRRRLRALRGRYAADSEVSVFYEVWHAPLTTVNGAHLISKVMRLCGGRNVFADLPMLAPQINIESVLARDPDAIIVSGTADARPDELQNWREYPELRAVAAGHLYFIDPDLIQRHTPRILDGAEVMCGQLERVRDGLPDNLRQ